MTSVQRFAGTVKALATVDISALAAWVAAIPLSDWHQQAPKPGIPLRPAMMTDLDWHGFGAVTDNAVGELLVHFPGCTAHQRMLSVVMPGDCIPEHVDEQAPDWIARVHVPLLSDGAAEFLVGDEAHRPQPGTAYLVNTLARHGVTNTGTTPRIHFMFDVRHP